MAEKLNKVCTNFAQDFTEQEKAQGRANIDAASAQELDELEERVEEIEGHQYTAGDNITIVDDVISATDTTYTAGSHVSIDPLNVISADVGDATITLVKDGVEVASFSANQKTDVSIDVETIAPTKPYISLERLDAYLYRVTFDSLPEPNPVPEPFIPGGCSSYVQDGKLYRNLDWNYDNAASFIVRTHDFVGMSYLTGLDDGHMDDDRIAQLPYRMVDGLNNDGIRVSTHVLFNDWQWTGTGERSVALTNLPYIVLSRVKSMATMSDDLGGVLGNLYAPDGLLATGYLIQLLVTDGTTTCAILPPTGEGQPFTIQDITTNPKLTNFRWVDRATVSRTDSDLQRRPTGIARWNMMPCELEDLRFTAAYESDARLDEFIGIRDTDKDSTDAELRAIYETAHAAYLHRERDGVTWQTMHSVVYGDHSMEHLWVQERWFKDEANNLPIHIYTAGENVSISEDDVISAVDTTYSAGEHIVIDDDNEISTEGLQETLTAGDNISIVDNVISAVDTTYSAGEHIVIDNNNEISTTGLQETLTAGDNISIVDNVISAVDTTYSAGEHIVIDGDNEISTTGLQETLTAGRNVSIDNNVISAVDTTYTGGRGIVITNENVIYTDAEPNVQSDWNETDVNADTYIRHKPNLEQKQDRLIAGENITIDSNNVISAVDTTYSAGEHIAIDSDNEISTEGLQETLTAGENISISSGNVISATDTKYTAGSHIAISSSNQISTTGLQNKLTASGHIVLNGDLIYDQGLQEKLVAGPNISISQNNNVISATDTTYTAGANITIDANNVISATSAPQVQSDWEQSDTSAVNYIRNKPDLSLKQDLLTAGENITIVDNVISATGGRDVQADWEESDTSDPAFIQNKPEQLELVAGTNVTLTSGENSIIISASNQGSNICWEQTTQGGTSRYPASLMVINQDTHRLSMDSVNLGTVVPLVSTVSTSNDRVLTVQANDTVPMWSDAPKGVFVGEWRTDGQSTTNTPFIDYVNAHAAGKALFCHKKVGNADNFLSLELITDDYVYFVSTAGMIDGTTYGNVTNGKLRITSDNTYSFFRAELQSKLTAGSNISIVPGANNTTVINNTMHESVIRESLFWSTLSNTEDRDFYYGPWRVHLHCDPILNNWNMENVYPKIFVRINYAGAPDTSLVNQGSYRVQNFNPYKNGFVRDDPQVSWNESNVHYYYEGVDPYTQTQSGSQWGFALHMTGEQPTTYEPENQPAHRFIVDSGRPFGDWLELEVETRFTAPNLAPSSSAILILFKGRYAYHVG